MPLYAGLTVFFGLLAVLGVVVPLLWIAFRYPGTPDVAEARMYLEEKAARERGADVIPAIPVPERERIAHEHATAA